MARALLTVLLALSCGLGPQPEAQTRIEAAIGLDPSKNGDTRTLRIALSGDWAQRWFRDGRWYLTPHWTLEAGHWESPDRGTSGVDRLSDIGVRLGVRMLRKGPWSNGLRPCLEASTGAHYLTSPRIDDREFSTHGQFGTAIGAGIRFGDRAQYELGWRFLHFSNSDIEEPNEGINFHLIRLGYQFE